MKHAYAETLFHDTRLSIDKQHVTRGQISILRIVFTLLQRGEFKIEQLDEVFELVSNRNSTEKRMEIQ